MLAKAFDGVLSGGVIDTNRENRIDDAEWKVMVTVLFCLREVGEGEFGYAIGCEFLDFSYGKHEFPPRKCGWVLLILSTLKL